MPFQSSPGEVGSLTLFLYAWQLTLCGVWGGCNFFRDLALLIGQGGSLVFFTEATAINILQNQSCFLDSINQWTILCCFLQFFSLSGASLLFSGVFICTWCYWLFKTSSRTAQHLLHEVLLFALSGQKSRGGTTAQSPDVQSPVLLMDSALPFWQHTKCVCMCGHHQPQHQPSS